jgi:DNA-directed RNA polymerase specialized sigma24 family protein
VGGTRTSSDWIPALHRKTAPLVRAAILGDKDALGELCILCKPIFTGYIYKYLTQRHLPLSMAEDLLQDTYLSIIKSFPYYDPSSGNIVPLMRTIVERVCAANANLKENRRKEIPMSDLAGSEDSEDSDWTVTDAMVVNAWMAENSPGYIESPPPLQNPQGDGGGRPRLNKPKVKKVRARRLSEDELQRRERVRQEWVAGESRSA